MTKKVFEFVMKDYGFRYCQILSNTHETSYTSNRYNGLVITVCEPTQGVKKLPAWAGLKTGEDTYLSGLTPAQLRVALEKFAMREIMRS